MIELGNGRNLFGRGRAWQAVQVFGGASRDVDARHKAGHDDY
jgi:hypothetical protein